jgi:hypothetical protein
LGEPNPYRVAAALRTSGSVSCPRCRLISPSSSLGCDCGWNFVDSVHVPSAAQRQSARKTREKALRRMAIGILLLLVGAFTGIGTGSVGAGAPLGLIGLALVVRGGLMRRSRR